MTTRFHRSAADAADSRRLCAPASARKRDGGEETLSLEDTTILVSEPNKDVDVVARDDALNALAGIDARKAQVVELHFFCGLISTRQ
jgi:hypothetical protein